jgi:hypothetical protein
LGNSIGDIISKIQELQATSEESISQKAQLEEDLKKHQVDRSSAKAAIAQATASVKKRLPSLRPCRQSCRQPLLHWSPWMLVERSASKATMAMEHLNDKGW